MNKIFSPFINVFSIRKTIRFELKPTPITSRFLDKNNVVFKDKEIKKLYQETMKPLIDDFHSRFIVESLESFRFDEKRLEKYKKAMEKARNSIREKNSAKKSIAEGEIESVAIDLRNDIHRNFLTHGDLLRERYAKLLDSKVSKKLEGGLDILLKQSLLDILIYENRDNKDLVEELLAFKGFWTYLGNFNNNRKNYYSKDAKSTGIANRIVNENLSRYINNLVILEGLLKYDIPGLSDMVKKLALDSYSNYITQTGIDEYNKIIGEINMEINLFCQSDKSVKPARLKPLFKQIGLGKEKVEILTIEDGKGWDSLKEMYNLVDETIYIDVKDLYKKFFEEMKGGESDVYDVSKVYFNAKSINTISNYWFQDWSVLGEILKKRVSLSKDPESNSLKLPKRDISLRDIRDSLMDYQGSVESVFKNKEEYKDLFIENNLWRTFINIWEYEVIEKVIPAYEEKAEKIADGRFDEDFSSKNSEQIVFLKESCDALLNLLRLLKYNTPKEQYLETDSTFYSSIEHIILNEKDIVDYYNALRNHVTKKPYSASKIKVNFENSNLLGGWSDGQENNKGGVIIKNGEKIYLGILVERGLFRTDKADNPVYKTTSNEWERLILQNLKFQTLAGKGFKGKYGISYGEMNPKDSYLKLQEFIRENYIEKYPQLIPLTQKRYKDKKEFDKDVQERLKDCFAMEFKGISEKVLKDAENEGNIYLFEIYNKDFSEGSKGKDNIHTLYWKGLFSDQNLKELTLSLDGGAEVFFRDSQKDKLSFRTDKKDKDVLEHRRYGEDKYFFHVPITINRNSPKIVKFNNLTREYIHKSNMNVIGIDRGEKHLVYYSVVNMEGEILEQGSLNTLNGIDYNKLLSDRAGDMKKAKKNWQKLGRIKDLKEGYLSGVIHEIYSLMLKYNAVVVLEDLNQEFKAKRLAKVEKSVYRKFEQSLARKLSHLIIKGRDINEDGGVLRGYQLTPSVPSNNVNMFEKSKQWGLLFHVRANYTSITDPVSGWRKHRYIGNNATVGEIKKFFNPKNKDGVEIIYSTEFSCWSFVYTDENTSHRWELCAKEGLERFRYDKKKKENYKVDLHEKLESLFDKYDKKRELYAQVESDPFFKWKDLVYFWNLLNQIRNTDRELEGGGNDFIQSPVYPFFDSRKADRERLPDNGDANGAYNIARKGVMLLSRIRDDKKDKPDLIIRDVDWDLYSLSNR